MQKLFYDNSTRQKHGIDLDFQNMVVEAPVAHSIDEVLNNANKLIAAFRKKKLPIVVVNVKPANAAWMHSP